MIFPSKEASSSASLLEWFAADCRGSAEALPPREKSADALPALGYTAAPRHFGHTALLSALQKAHHQRIVIYDSAGNTILTNSAYSTQFYYYDIQGSTESPT